MSGLILKDIEFESCGIGVSAPEGASICAERVSAKNVGTVFEIHERHQLTPDEKNKLRELMQVLPGQPLQAQVSAIAQSGLPKWLIDGIAAVKSVAEIGAIFGRFS